MLNFFKPKPETAAARALFDTIVDRSREAAFYSAYGAPDTIEGRFDLLTLHAWLVMQRLKGEGPAAEAVSQKLFDTLFKDMDDNLREIGVGDLTVPKKIRVMAEAFYGRVSVYSDAMAEEGDGALAEALRKNVYAGNDAAPADRLAAYVRTQAEVLSEQPAARIMGGVVRFAPLQARLEAAAQ